MDKDWIVEVWGDWRQFKIATDVFYTKREAETYFKSIRRRLDSSKYIFTRNSIVEIANEENAIYLTNLNEY